MAGGTQAGAQVALSGANASLVNNTGHGVAVSATQTVITGGTTSTSLTLNDRAATFANTVTGGPTTVTGVADGVADFDGQRSPVEGHGETAVPRYRFDNGNRQHPASGSEQDLLAGCWHW